MYIGSNGYPQNLLMMDRIITCLMSTGMGAANYRQNLMGMGVGTIILVPIPALIYIYIYI